MFDTSVRCVIVVKANVNFHCRSYSTLWLLVST